MRSQTFPGYFLYVDALELELSLDEASPTRPKPPKEWLAPAPYWRNFLYALSDWALIALAWTVAFYSSKFDHGNVFYPVAAVWIAGRFHALGAILHDLTHIPLKKKTASLRMLEVLVGYPISSTMNAMRYHHLRHHRHNGTKQDPYFKARTGGFGEMLFLGLRSALLVPWWTIRPVIGILALGIPSLRNFYGRYFLQDRSEKDLTHSREVLECAREEFGQLAFWIAVLLAIHCWPHFMTYYWLIPLELAGVLAGMRLLGEHRYERIENQTVSSIVQSTCDQHLGWTGVILAPRNIGYHIVHHLHPTAPLQRLPDLRRWYMSNHPALYLSQESS